MIRAKVKIKSKGDHRTPDQILAEYSKVPLDHVARAGVRSQAPHPNSDLTVAQLAKAHEQGEVPGVMARPFLTVAVEMNRKKWADWFSRKFNAISTKRKPGSPQTRKDTLAALEQLSKKMQADVLHIFDAMIDLYPLKPSTVAKNGGRLTPLNDTGTIRRNIEGYVEKKK